ISGTPTAAGAYSFTVRATDANSVTATQSYSGTIAAALAITTSTLPMPVLTTAYSQTVATSGGTAPITFAISSGTLPTAPTLRSRSHLGHADRGRRLQLHRARDRREQRHRHAELFRHDRGGTRDHDEQPADAGAVDRLQPDRRDLGRHGADHVRDLGRRTPGR